MNGATAKLPIDGVQCFDDAVADVCADGFGKELRLRKCPVFKAEENNAGFFVATAFLKNFREMGGEHGEHFGAVVRWMAEHDIDFRAALWQRDGIVFRIVEKKHAGSDGLFSCFAHTGGRAVRIVRDGFPKFLEINDWCAKHTCAGSRFHGMAEIFRRRSGLAAKLQDGSDETDAEFLLKP